MIDVLFVCLGNICRSPMAEATFRHQVAAAGLSDQISTSSAGTGDWHVGETAHFGTLDVLSRNSIAHDGRARQVVLRDLEAADYVVAMDRDNVAGLRSLRLSPALDRKITRLLDETPDTAERDVPDPWYTGNFDHVYDLVGTATAALLDRIRREHNL